ncbi:uncharacterized protein LOC128994566 [Macrosteles quadrilineatus]|uniref:uncharacterized protein LOC128994566 n=1 Tax=Macrosteles quadrilineatus TaxID=74068 RepID=UPI0023E1BFAC|nr:uncharacterized protein LOC128994566 [Macrosteles quadrilineatus]
MIEVLPVELVEEILLYLTVIDVYNFFQAFDKNHHLLSEHFWRKICLGEDFLKVYNRLEWFECFEIGMNKRLGKVDHCCEPPVGKLEHVYSSSIVVRDDAYNVYSLKGGGSFELVQSISSPTMYFKDEFVFTQTEQQTTLYRHNWESNQFDVCATIEETLDVIGISNKYFVMFQSKKKLIKIHYLSNNKYTTLPLPEDVKFIIEKILHNDNIVISAVTFNDGYRIKTYDISQSKWVLDLKCFTSTGITNDPNVWVGDNFIACCDASYRLRGIYFGPFKVWNIQGEKVIEAEIDPSNQHYLRCFFKEKHILLTTSDNCIKVFNSSGNNKSSIQFKTTFQDIKLSTGNLLFVMINDNPLVEIYNWKTSCYLYSLSLTYICNNSLLSENLYCPYNNNKYEVFRFL